MDQFKSFFKRYFIPHEGNNYQPHILQKSAALGILFLILTTFTTINIQSLILISSEWYASSILPAVLVDLTNDNRENGSLGTLSRNSVLDEAARLKAEDMAAREYFAHDSPDGLTPWYWFERVGYAYAYAGENLAVHFTDSDEVVDAWMRSPGHRANIMKSEYTEIGIGTARGSYKGSPTIFVVQLFGQPLSIEARARIVATVAAEDEAFEESLDTTIAGTTTNEEPTTETTPVPPIVAPLPPEDVPVVLSDEDMPEEAPLASSTLAVASSTDSTTTPATEVVFETPVPKQGTFVSSDVATESPFVSRGVIDASLLPEGDGPTGVHVSNSVEKLVSRPNLVISLIYSILAALVFAAIAVSVAIEWRRQHPVQVLYGAGLLAAMWVALYVHTALFSGALIA